MTTPLEVGSLVHVRDQAWLLTRAQRHGACTVLSLDGRDRSNAMERIRVIDPFDRPRAISTGALVRRRRRVVLRRALAAIRTAQPADGLWTAAQARIDLHAYQLEPALAAINGATRLLLADAVGLGKTIQAGLLLSELSQRGWIERALIVCPAGLRDTWRRELHDRFALTAAILDQPSIADRVACFPPGINPWMADRIAIVSIDYLKRDEVLAALDGVPIDLLIADEAHHLSPGTDRGAAVARLAKRSAWCVLVSATPHSGDCDAFDALTNLGRHGDDICIFRRERADVGLADARRTHFLDVRRDRDEDALLDAIGRYARAIWSARGRDNPAARLVAMTIARRACSSAAAVERTLRRRRALLGSDTIDAPQPCLPWDDDDEADGDDHAAIVAAPGLASVADEHGALDELVALAARCSSSSKLRRLMRILSRVHEPAIIFTEYRDTLDVIVRAMSGAHRVASIHGAMPRDLRTGAVDQFNAGAFDVLVATDAAGEGLNLHHRCRLVIDFELPWSPLRLEQRVGRVDRLGQRRIVHAIRLFHGGTIEQDVLDRLALRRQRALHDLDRAVTEREVAAAVFDGWELAAAAAPAVRTSRVASAAREVERISRHRCCPLPPAPARCFAPPRRHGARVLDLIVRETHVNAHGFVLGSRAHALELTLVRRPRSMREWRFAITSAAGRFEPCAPIGPSADRRAIIERVTAIRTQRARDQPREYQRSLFDGRADAAQSARQQDASHLDAALARIACAVAPADPACTRLEVVAAWPGRRR